MNNFIFQLPGDKGNCFYSSVSILRVALGYNSPYPENLKKPEVVYTSFIVENANKLFHNHRVSTFCDKKLEGYAYDYKGLWPENKDLGNFLWMFAYSTEGERLFKERTGDLCTTHTVVGTPSLHKGMIGNYAVRILVEE